MSTTADVSNCLGCVLLLVHSFVRQGFTMIIPLQLFGAAFDLSLDKPVYVYVVIQVMHNRLKNGPVGRCCCDRGCNLMQQY